MNACETNLLLQALMDGELDAANTLRVEQHLRSCAGCAQALRDLQAVRTALRTPITYAAPEALRRRVVIALQADAKNRPGPGRGALGLRAGSATGSSANLRWWAPRGFGAAVAGVLILALVGSWQTGLEDDLVADHVRSLQANHLTDVETSNRHVVKPWFNGRVAFAPTVVDFAEQGFPLAGGRLDYVKGQAAAALVYRRRLHVINVFVWPAASPLDGLVAHRHRDGYTLMHWSSGGLNYWAVSDLDAAELRQFADLYVTALK